MKSRISFAIRILGLLLTAAWIWLAAPLVCWAARSEPEAPSGGASWAMSYGVVLLGICLGMLCVCRMARRRDRARPEQYKSQNLLDDGEE